MNRHSYLKIPLDYVCVYNKLAYCLLAYGIDIIKDCSASCKQVNKDIIEYWNLFQLAIICYDKGDVGKAEYFINYIKNNLDRIYKSDIVQNYNGANNYFLDENGKYTCIVCNGWVYELPNIKTSYEFILNTNTITDNGKGQTANIDITSTKTMSDETSSSTEEIGYNAIINDNWISYNNQTKQLSIKPNTVEYREAQVSFIQNESYKEVVLQIRQNKDTTEYEYYFEYEPKEINFDKEGGEVQLVVTKSSKRELQDGSPIGNEIAVEWNATIDGYGFNYNPFTNQITAEANDYKERTGTLIISRPELGSSKDIEIPITQQAGALTIIYSLQAVASQTILPALNGKTTLTIISTKQGYYGAEPVGEPEQVGFVISSARGFLTGASINGAVWTMSENITEAIREDVLIITQNSAEGKEVRINITQQPAVIDYVYDFRSEASTVRVEATGGQKTINVISTKQKTINDKNYGDPTIIDYTSNITGDFEINKNIINIPENSEETEKSETATFIQDESNKQFIITVVQNAATERYEYTFYVNEGTEVINFNAKGGTVDKTVTSTKQRYLNDEPQGKPEEVPFEVIVYNNDGGNSFSLSNITERGFTVNAVENKTKYPKNGNVRIIQSESDKPPINIGITQNAGVIDYIYTFNVEEDSFDVPNYESGGITRYLTITSYREKTINGVKEGDPIDVNFNIENSTDWINTNNNSNVININENLTDKRTGTITIKQTLKEENYKTINIFQDATSVRYVDASFAPSFGFNSQGDSVQTKNVTIRSYNYRNEHIIEDEQYGTIKGTDILYQDKSIFSIYKESDTSVTATCSKIAEAASAEYEIRTTISTITGSITYNYVPRNILLNYKLNIISNIYLLIPENYIVTYQKLILLIVNNHSAIIAKPTNIINKQLIDCWNLFQSAVAAYNLGFEKQADFFINFIDCNIDKIINNIGIADSEWFDVKYPNMIGFIGELDLDNINFYTNIEDGQMYIEYENTIKPKDVNFEVKEDGNLYQKFN